MIGFWSFYRFPNVFLLSTIKKRSGDSRTPTDSSQSFSDRFLNGGIVLSSFSQRWNRFLIGGRLKNDWIRRRRSDITRRRPSCHRLMPIVFLSFFLRFLTGGIVDDWWNNQIFGFKFPANVADQWYFSKINRFPHVFPSNGVVGQGFNVHISNCKLIS